MPREAEDLAEDLTFLFLDADDWLQELQRRVIKQADNIQHAPKAILNPSVTATSRRMQALQREMLKHFQKDFDPIYLAGARTITPTYTIDPAARRFLAGMNTQEYLKLRNVLKSTVMDTRRFMEMVWNDRIDRRRALGTRHSRVDVSNVDHPERSEDVTDKTIRLRGIKGASYADGRRYSIGDYGGMVSRTNANRAYNMGTIHAASKAGIEYLTVNDGPDCGWSFHGDTELASGKVVTLGEAAAFPIAHPNCQRSFRPATPKEIATDKEKRAKAARAAKARDRRKAARTAAVVAVGGITALGATNLLAAGTSRFAGSRFFNEMVQKVAIQAFQGDASAQRLVLNLRRFQSKFGDIAIPDPPVYSITPADFAMARKNRIAASDIYPNAPIPLPELPLTVKIRAYADGFIEGLELDRIPKAIKRAVGAAEEATVLQMGERFQSFYFAMKKAAMAEDTVENIKRVIDMEVRRRGTFYRELEKLDTTVRATWSQWGPRARIDMTDWLRGKVTATPTGLIRSLTVNAAGQVRTSLKMYQDGTLGGHISVLPKKFLNGVVRGIVELDENGRLIGNIRLVPGGPLRVRLEFITTGERTDLRDFMDSPLGALGDMGERFRHFKLDRVVFDLKVFNESIFDISANLRIPVETVRATIDELARGGQIRYGANGRVSGVFQYIVHNPERIKEVFADAQASVFGNIRFSTLTQAQAEASPYLSMLKRQNVRLLNRAHLTAEGLQNVSTNLKIHGWNIYDVANVLRLRVDQVKELIQQGFFRLKNFMEDLSLKSGDDLLPVWDKRVASVTKGYQRSAAHAGGNEFTAVRDSLQAVNIGPGEVNPIQTRSMLKLAGIERGMPSNEVYNKLRNTLEWIKMNEALDSKEIEEILGTIDEQKMRIFAREIGSRGNAGLRVLKMTDDDFDEFIDIQAAISGPDPLSRSNRRGIFGEVTRDRAAGEVPWRSVTQQGDLERKAQTILVTDERGNVTRVDLPEIMNMIDNPRGYGIGDGDSQLWDDIFEEYNFMSTRYRNAPRPAFAVTDDVANSPAYASRAFVPGQGDRQLIIVPGRKPDTGTVSHWFEKYRETVRELGIVRDQIGDVVGTNYVWIHEYSHHLAFSWMDIDPYKFKGMWEELAQYIGADVKLDHAGSARQRRVLSGSLRRAAELPIDETFVGLDPDDPFGPLDAVADELGSYATTSTHELMAEALRHWLTMDHPGPIATIVGTAFDTYFGV